MKEKHHFLGYSPSATPSMSRNDAATIPPATRESRLNVVGTQITECRRPFSSISSNIRRRAPWLLHLSARETDARDPRPYEHDAPLFHDVPPRIKRSPGETLGPGLLCHAPARTGIGGEVAWSWVRTCQLNLRGSTDPTRSPGAMRRHRGFLQAENDAGGEPATTNYPRYLCRYVTSAVREPRQSPGARRGERS